MVIKEHEMTDQPWARRHILAAGALLPVFFLARPASALEPVFSSRGKAIRGFDPVAYFTEGKPVEGASDFTHTWMDAQWFFASAENRDAFAAEPERFAPRYGGYCAWAVSQGYTASIDPEAWSIVDDRLYLNYSKSVRRQWEKNIPGNISKANRNWPRLLAEG